MVYRARLMSNDKTDKRSYFLQPRRVGLAAYAAAMGKTRHRISRVRLNAIRWPSQNVHFETISVYILNGRNTNRLLIIRRKIENNHGSRIRFSKNNIGKFFKRFFAKNIVAVYLLSKKN